MKALKELRAKIVGQIIDIVTSIDGDELSIVDIEEGYSPILQEDESDEDNTYTLDTLYVENGELYLDGSSSCENSTWRGSNLNIEILESVLEFLEEHEDEINELSL